MAYVEAVSTVVPCFQLLLVSHLVKVARCQCKIFASEKKVPCMEEVLHHIGPLNDFYSKGVGDQNVGIARCPSTMTLHHVHFDFLGAK